jgi:hypothetical protein
MMARWSCRLCGNGDMGVKRISITAMSSGSAMGRTKTHREFKELLGERKTCSKSRGMTLWLYDLISRGLLNLMTQIQKLVCVGSL